MKQAYLRPVIYFFFWLFVSVVIKALFIGYHYTKAAELTFLEIFKVFLYGLRMDASFAAYLCAVPFICFLLESLKKHLYLYRLVNGYTFLIILVVAGLVTADLEMYNAWGYRLDATPLQYLNTPQEMVASVSAAPVFLLTAIFLLLVILFAVIYHRVVNPLLKKKNNAYFSKGSRVMAFCCLALLIIPIRGGLQHIPINQSDVYFSNKLFANHAAVNLPWNVLYSLNRRNYAAQNPYKYMAMGQARKYVDSLYVLPASADNQNISVLKSTRPNVLFIILESNTAKLVGCLGGEPGVTPHIDELAREGILFTNIYSSGDRSEKGLVALLSGYPVQTTTSIIKLPRKTEHLPHLSQVLKAQGYGTSYYYGGELAFANIKSYLLNAGYDRLVSKFDFPSKTYNSKWGVHDHVLLNRWLTDLKNDKQPFFSTLFTLSSHEPYDIPIPAKFAGSDEATKFKNSMYYTDYAIGNFIEEAKKQPWWNNTVIVMAADHGHRFPGDDPNFKPSKFRIPFLLTGGALKQAYPPVSIIGSQTDIVPTLLHQLKLPTEQFKWGKDLLNPATKSFAFYVFNDGFGYVTPAGTITFDNVAKQVITKDYNVPPQQLNYGKAYMELSFEDYLNK
ncbi:LTA synthase family protein [Adhaeribacter radiodurans]|uniref:Sulfatase-like hydrolase/transferase n=1 Tax=Adhaeribacter radiodurans TaxID=2745197 RepID=A0A7L7L653_9BACT|nr:alkaline phosphatase family protein [Adhaeribacter radiodurans]QMU28297.1 sulfatase-like hydrolase/transferase [Adhaeribacter radiodurans]